MLSLDDIQSGDLLVWSKDKRSTISNVYLNVIRFATSSEYAHTAIAWRINGRLFIVEATMPNIRLIPVMVDDEFFHIPMGLEWQNESEEYLIDKLGLLYSLFDAMRGYLGITLENDRKYQCAELCKEFYELHGIVLGNSFTPAKLVNDILENYGKSMTMYKQIKPGIPNE
jgi:hypothetical protein